MIEAREEKENMKQEVISGIAAALIDAGMIDTEKFANKVEIAGKVSMIVDEQLEEYALIKTEDLIDIATEAVQRGTETTKNGIRMLSECLM